MEILFLLVGLVFVAVGLAVVASEMRTRSGATEVQGELVGFSTGRSGASAGRSFYAVARYVGPDGRTRYVEGSVGSSAPMGKVGDVVTVLVQPFDPGKATVRSPLSYVLGGVFAVMGLACCVVFFAVFRATTFSIFGAVAVVGCGAWKLRGILREKPLSAQAWTEYKSKLLPRVFAEDAKEEIRWADPAAVEAADRRQEKTNRVGIPVMALAGVGLLILGAHLHRRTNEFLAVAVPTAGVVVDLEASHSTDSTTYAPIVEFQHEGDTYRFRDSVSSNPSWYHRGDAVRVLYDPSHPTDARIDRGRWNTAVPILVAGFGALFCGLGIWLALRSRRA